MSVLKFLPFPSLVAEAGREERMPTHQVQMTAQNFVLTIDCFLLLTKLQVHSNQDIELAVFSKLFQAEVVFKSQSGR